MQNMKNEIELRLIGSLLSDWCRQKAENNKSVIYRSGFDSAHRIIRFATPALQSLFALPESSTGHWGNEFAVMYEIANKPDGIFLSCVAASDGLSKRECKRMQVLAEACGAVEQDGVYRLVQWNICEEISHTNGLTNILNQVFDFELAYFETELAVWKTDLSHKIRQFPQDSHILVSNSELPEEIYMEGAQKTILLNRYERNPKARARCIAAHGSTCKICGFDFGIAFGAEFSGKIEVHHIKPISEIGKEYIVDPVRDLIPVCPNCHMMLHSKSDGTFSIDELKGMRVNHI